MYFLWKLVFGSLALAFTQHHNKKLSVCSRSMSSPNQGWTGDNDLDQGCSKGDRGRGNFTWCPWQLNLFFFFLFKPRVLRSVYLFWGCLSFCTSGLMSQGPPNHCACTVILAQLPSSWTHSQAWRLRQRMDLSHCLHGGWHSSNSKQRC